MTGKVTLTIGKTFPYSTCRACGMSILWFSVFHVQEEWEDEDEAKPVVRFNQVCHKSDPCYCPYCGEKALYEADDNTTETGLDEMV